LFEARIQAFALVERNSWPCSQKQVSICFINAANAYLSPKQVEVILWGRWTGTNEWTNHGTSKQGSSL